MVYLQFQFELLNSNKVVNTVKKSCPGDVMDHQKRIVAFEANSPT